MAIKYRGDYSAAGHGLANWMQDNGGAVETRLRGDSVVRKNGDFLNVFVQIGALTDGYYAVGDLSGGATRIFASPTAREPFIDRGPAPDNGGFTMSELGFWGKGWGTVAFPTDLGYFEDFDGGFAHATEYALKRTRDGKTLQDWYVFALVTPINAWLTYGAQATQVFGGYRESAGSVVFSAGVSTTLLSPSGQYLPAYIYDDGSGNVQIGATEFYTNQLAWYADINVLAPGVLLKMDRYVRPDYSGGLGNPLDCPGLRFNYSTDGGLTWSPVTSNNVFASELATVLALPAVGYHDRFNDAMAWARMDVAPLSRTLAVMVAHVPYITYTGDTPSVKVKVKLALVDTSAGCSITATTTLFDGDPTESYYFNSRSPLAVPGGVLVFTRPSAGGAEWNAPARVMFTADGTGLTERSFMPLAEYRTGIPTGIDRGTLVCPMYDGGGVYTLYASKDWGTTWAPRTIIATGGAAPPTGSISMSSNFSRITKLRENNAAANAAPATPWQYDCRVQGP